MRLDPCVETWPRQATTTKVRPGSSAERAGVTSMCYLRKIGSAKLRTNSDLRSALSSQLAGVVLFFFVASRRAIGLRRFGSDPMVAIRKLEY